MKIALKQKFDNSREKIVIVALWASVPVAAAVAVYEIHRTFSDAQ